MAVDIQYDAKDEVSSQIARNCLLTRTRQVSRGVTTIYDDALRPFGINAIQFSILVLFTDSGAGTIRIVRR
ncbi:UNVERIFIED_ORG: hypothetical protein BDU10_9998 [Burkholderia sp. CF145]|jgi:hypothetical protein